MTHSPYERPNSAAAPNHQPGLEVPIQERAAKQEEQSWYQSLTEEEYRDYRREAWSVARLFLENTDDIKELIDAVFEELCQIQEPLTRSQIKAYLRRRTKWRAIDQLRSRSYQQRRRQLSLSSTTEDGEPAALEQLIVDGAEETFFQELETLEMDEGKERRLALLHQAIMHTKDAEQRVCFVLKHTYGKQPAAIANELNIPVETVYAHLRLGMKQVISFIKKLEKKDEKAQQQKLPP